MSTAAGTRILRGRATPLRTAGIAAIIAAAFVVLVVGVYPGGANAQTAPSLGGAESFAVLGGTTVTNTSTTNVYGDLGVNPGTAVTGFSSVDGGAGTVHGTIYTGADPEAVDARSGVTAAYNDLAGQACSEDLTGLDLGGRTLTEGVYCFDTSAAMTGTLTLDGEGNPDAIFIIRTGSTLTTASASSVSLVNDANACNVFWQVGSSATLGTSTTFAGNILANDSITLNSGASITGRALAGAAGAVTMDNNIVDTRQCTEAATSEPSTATPTAAAEDTLTPVPPATATAIADATSTAIAEDTLTPVPPATATAIADATSTAIAEDTLTPVPPATATAIADATSTAIAEDTLTPVPPATATAIADATSTAIAEDTLTPAPSGTATPTAEATSTPAARDTPTTAAPGPPSTGSGPPGDSAPSLAIAVAGAGFLLVGAGGLVVFAARRGGRNRPV